MKLNRLIAVSIVGFSLITTSTSAFACDHEKDSHSWSFFGWCTHDDKDKDKDCDHHHHDGGGDCNHGGGSTSGGGTSTGSGGVGPKG